METARTKTGYQLDRLHVDAKPFSQLSTQQARTLLYVASGARQKDIAAAMGVKLCTVKKVCSALGYKFDARTMRETVHKAIQQGVLKYTLSVLLLVTPDKTCPTALPTN